MSASELSPEHPQGTDQVDAAMTAIYRTILERIEARAYDVFSRRVRLSRLEKVGLAARAWWRWRVSTWRD